MRRATTSEVNILSAYSQDPPPEGTILQVWGRAQESAFVTDGLILSQVVQTQEAHENTQRQTLMLDVFYKTERNEEKPEGGSNNKDKLAFTVWNPLL